LEERKKEKRKKGKRKGKKEREKNQKNSHVAAIVLEKKRKEEKRKKEERRGEERRKKEERKEKRREEEREQVNMSKRVMVANQSSFKKLKEATEGELLSADEYNSSKRNRDLTNKGKKAAKRSINVIQEAFNQSSVSLCFSNFQSSRAFQSGRHLTFFEKVPKTLNGEALDSARCLQIRKYQGALDLDSIVSYLRENEIETLPVQFFSNFDNQPPNEEQPILQFEYASHVLRIKQCVSAMTILKEIRSSSRKKRLPNGVSMPTFLSVSQVKARVLEQVNSGEILLGESISTESVKDYLLPGARVVRGDCLIEILPSPDASEADLRDIFPNALEVIVLGDRSFVLFSNSEDAQSLFGKSYDIVGMRCRTYPKKVSRSGGILSDVHNSLLKILERDYDKMTFSRGYEHEVKLLIWIDAKFTCFEKSFAKISLMSEVFVGWKSSLERWVDLEGHEDQFLRKDVLEKMLEQLDCLGSSQLSYKDFTFRVVEAKDIADEKSHQSRNCYYGSCRCGGCNGQSELWKIDPYHGDPFDYKDRENYFEKTKEELAHLLHKGEEKAFAERLKGLTKLTQVPELDNLLPREGSLEKGCWWVEIEDTESKDELIQTVNQKNPKHPHLGKTHISNLVKLLVSRNYGSGGTPMWVRKEISIPVYDCPPSMHAAMTCGRNIITLLDDLLSEPGLNFDGDGSLISQKLNGLVEEDLKRLKSSPRSPFASACSIRRIFSFQSSLMEGVDRTFAALVELFSWVTQIIYEKPENRSGKFK